MPVSDPAAITGNVPVSAPVVATARVPARLAAPVSCSSGIAPEASASESVPPPPWAKLVAAIVLPAATENEPLFVIWPLPVIDSAACTVALLTSGPFRLSAPFVVFRNVSVPALVNEPPAATVSVPCVPSVLPSSSRPAFVTGVFTVRPPCV